MVMAFSPCSAGYLLEQWSNNGNSLNPITKPLDCFILGLNILQT